MTYDYREDDDCQPVEMQESLVRQDSANLTEWRLQEYLRPGDTVWITPHNRRAKLVVKLREEFAPPSRRRRAEPTWIVDRRLGGVNRFLERDMRRVGDER